MTPIAANKATPRLLNRHLPSSPRNVRQGEGTDASEYSWPRWLKTGLD
jgi:hypothetical protein